MRLPLLTLCFLFPLAALAVDTDRPPEPTPTTVRCTGGAVWHSAGAVCVAPGDDRLDDDTLYAAAREFVHAGQHDHAIGALAAMEDQRSDRVLSYMGVALRGSGAPDGGLAYYASALAANPDNLLARSYMGQGLVELGDLAGAERELAEIRARGGAGTWPEIALLRAISTGTSTY